MIKLFRTLFVALILTCFVGVDITEAQARKIQETIVLEIGGEEVPATRYVILTSNKVNWRVETSYTLSGGNPEIPEKGINKVEYWLDTNWHVMAMINPKGKIVRIELTYVEL